MFFSRDRRSKLVQPKSDCESQVGKEVQNVDPPPPYAKRTTTDDENTEPTPADAMKDCSRCCELLAPRDPGYRMWPRNDENGFSYFMDQREPKPKCCNKEVLLHFLSHCTPAYPSVVTLAPIGSNGYWVHCAQVECELQLVHDSADMMVMTKYMIPNDHAYDTIGKRGSAGDERWVYARGLLQALNVQLCSHIDIRNGEIQKEILCNERHQSGKVCLKCPYPMACEHCFTEMESHREILPDGRKCLVLTTWKELGARKAETCELWNRMTERNEYMSSFYPVREAKQRQRARAIIAGLPQQLEERSIKYIVQPSGVVERGSYGN